MTTQLQNLCSLCQGIDIETLSREGGYRYYGSVAQFYQSSEKCTLCNAFYGELVNWMGGRRRWNGIQDDEHCMILRLHPVHKSSILFEAFLVEDPEDPTTISTSAECVTDAFMRLYTDVDDPAIEYGIMPWRDVKCTSSPDSLATARGWVKECVETHNGVDDFGSTNGPPDYERRSTDRPTRLVELLEPSEFRKIRLVDTNKEQVETYVALSHCWGAGPWPWRTVKSNLTERFEAVSENDLPDTLKDACFATRQLHARYIWIDSLCIVQDDEQDWLREAAKMGSIYRGSLVTIAASTAADNRSGLFNTQSRNQKDELTSFAPIRSTLSDGRQSVLYFCGRRRGRSAWYNDMERSPLNGRAWVCQERILSPRTIHFSESQLFWECLHSITAEDNIHHQGTQYEGTNSIINMTWRRPFLDQVSQTSSTISQHKVSGAEKLNLSEIWYRNLVQDTYSGRQLTYGKDKLVAISAMARAIHKCRPMSYYAGLWGDSVWQGLLWFSSGSPNMFSAESPSRKSKVYRAPSWSWASQDTGVSYYEASASSEGQIDGAEVCKVLGVNTTLATEDPFGAVSGGQLKLETIVLECHYQIVTGQARTLRPITFPSLDGDVEGDMLPDDDDDDPNRSMLALVLWLPDAGNHRPAFAMLVRSSPTDVNTYLRVGAAYITGVEKKVPGISNLIAVKPAERLGSLPRRKLTVL